MNVEKLGCRPCERKHGHLAGAGPFQDSGTGRDRGPGGHDVIHQNDVPAANALGLRHRKYSTNIFPARGLVKAALRRGRPRSCQYPCGKVWDTAPLQLSEPPAKPLRKKLRLVIAAFTFARTMERDGNNHGIVVHDLKCYCQRSKFSAKLITPSLPAPELEL